MKLVPVLILIGGVYTLHDAGFPIKETIEKFPATVKEAVISNYEKSKPVNVEKLKEEIPKVNINLQNCVSHQDYNTAEEALKRRCELGNYVYKQFGSNFTSGFEENTNMIIYTNGKARYLEVTYYGCTFSSVVGQVDVDKLFLVDNLRSFTSSYGNLTWDVWRTYRKIRSPNEWVFFIMQTPSKNGEASSIRYRVEVQWTKESHFYGGKVVTNSYEDFVELWRTGVILGIFRQMPGWTDYAEDVLIDSTTRVLKATTGDVKYESKNITFSCVPSHQRHH